MATNMVYEDARRLYLDVPVGTLAGDPVAVGKIVGVAQFARDVNGKSVVDTAGAYNLDVKAVDGVGNSAVAIGDQLYYVAADTPKLSKKDTGVPFGKALSTVAAGATATIPVKIG